MSIKYSFNPILTEPICMRRYVQLLLYIILRCILQFVSECKESSFRRLIVFPAAHKYRFSEPKRLPPAAAATRYSQFCLLTSHVTTRIFLKALARTLRPAESTPLDVHFGKTISIQTMLPYLFYFYEIQNIITYYVIK